MKDSLKNEEAQRNVTPPPYLVSYAFTKKCNLKCKHCYSDAAEECAQDELSTGEAEKVLDEFAHLGIKLLIFDGGEPLCREDIFHLARYASGKGLRVVVGSNGTLINMDMAEKLKSSGIMAVQISIDGANARTHDWFRGEDGSFNKAMEGARACKATGLPFQFGMTIRRGTLNEIPDMLKLAVDSGATAAEFFDLVQVQRVKREIPNEVLTPDERKKVMQWLAEAQRDCPIIIRVPGCPMYTLLLQEKDIQPKHFPAGLLKRIPYHGRGCAAGMPNGYLTILPNGDVIGCMLLQIKLGNVKKESITQIWNNSQILLRLRNRNLLEGECGRCIYRDKCAGCRGRAYEETGNALATDPGCWVNIEGKLL
ncbi:MAG TPA: radical SAM protein [Chitinivibrionales bacterium]|jgi:radical SAM protein with 4Fe4S-binding SPASM domain|nr:radical SAM protein [Chitinivibrionales bacterium]